MERSTLARWLLRSVNKAARVELVHRHPEDGERVIQSYPLEGCSAETLDTIAAELLADAQVEADMAGTRMSLLIVCRREDDSMGASVRLRAQAVTHEQPEDVQEEASRDGVTRMLMDQNKFLNRELGAMYPRMRAMFDDTVRFLGTMLKEAREENVALRKENTLLREQAHARYGESEEDADIVAELKIENDRRTAFFDRAITESVELVKVIAASAVAARNTTNGHAPGANQAA